jgi:hypothetical protein
MRKWIKDLWFAAYLLRKGYDVTDFECFDPVRKRFQYSFEIKSEDEYKKLKLEFKNSDESRIKQRQSELLDLVK